MNLLSLRLWLRPQRSYFVALLILLSSRLIVGLAVVFSEGFVQRAPGFVSFTRYAMLAFPLFIIAGRIFQERVWLGFSVIGLSAAMLFMYTWFYAQWYWAG